jgi:hypothetical protein
LRRVWCWRLWCVGHNVELKLESWWVQWFVRLSSVKRRPRGACGWLSL